jgi:hypothetical protein
VEVNQIRSILLDDSSESKGKEEVALSCQRDFPDWKAAIPGFPGHLRVT